MIQTCFSFGMTFDGFPSSVTTADKKTPTKTGAKTNCKTKEKKQLVLNTKGTQDRNIKGWSENRKNLLPGQVKVAKLRLIIQKPSPLCSNTST